MLTAFFPVSYALESGSNTAQADDAPTVETGAVTIDEPVLDVLDPVHVDEAGAFEKQPEQQPAATAESTGTSQEPLKARAVVVDIDSNTLSYDREADIYTATGAVHVIISEQNSELIADKVTYDKNKQLLVAEGNVVIIKDGQRTEGVYAKIDLTRKSALINDPVTQVDTVRVNAKTAFVDSRYVELENGRIIVDRKHFAQKRHQQKLAEDPDRPLNDEELSRLAFVNEYLDEDQILMSQNDGSAMSKFRMHAREIEVIRHDDGYNEMNFKSPSLRWGKYKLSGIGTTDFSYDSPTGDIEYLGPDVGYDPDFGGFYLGPGWDFRAGRGIVRVSPLVSFGGGGRRARGGRSFENTGVGPGVGGVLHYRHHRAKLDLGYNSRVGQPVLFAEKKLFDGKTKLMAAMNEDYNSGFLGYERPRYIAQLTDSRKIGEYRNFRLDTYESIGVAHDEFFPTNRSDFFVDPKDKDASPATAGRVQLQAQIQNVEPLFEVGEKFLKFGFVGQMALAGYSTGDFVGLLRAGPTMRVNVKDRFFSSMKYFLSGTAGETPFVFDTYYRGRQNLVLTNALRVNNFLTIGTQNNLNLNRDNDQNALAVGNALFLTVGPKSVKFNLAYDFIRKRSYFGLNFYPGSGANAIDFDTLKMFQPVNYGLQPNP